MRYPGLTALCFLLLFPSFSREGITGGTAKTPISRGVSSLDVIYEIVIKTQKREYWHPRLRNIEVVGIKWNVEYENVKDLDIPFASLASSALPSGLNIRMTGGVIPDVQIIITATCRALGRSYPEGFLYTGALVKGKISFEAKGLKLEENFEGTIEPPGILREEVKANPQVYEDPKQAPIYSALFLKGSFWDKLGRIYYKAFGPYTLVSMYIKGDPLYGDYQQALDPLLKEIGEPLVEAFTYLLGSSSEGVSVEAAQALGAIKSPKAIPALLSVAIERGQEGDKFHEVLRRLAREPKGMEELLSCFRDKDYRIRAKSAEILGMVGGDKAVKALISALKDRSLDVRRSSVKALARLKDIRALEALISVAENRYEDREVREWAVKALGEIGDPRAVESLRKLLRSEEELPYTLKETIGEALAKIPQSPPSLPELLSKWRTTIKHRVIGEARELEEALARYGASLVEPLLPIVENPEEDEELRSSALRILSGIKDDRLFKPFLSIAQNDRESLVMRFYATIGLGNCKAEEASDFLLFLLADSEKPEVMRIAAAYALGEKRERRAIEPLFSALLSAEVSPPLCPASPDMEVITLSSPYGGSLPSAAAKALAKIGMPALGRIRDALSDANPRVRSLMLAGIGEIEEKWAQELLLSSALKDPSPKVRLEGAKHLVKKKDPQVMDILLSVLEDENAEYYLKGEAVRLIGEFCYTAKVEFRDKRFSKPLIQLLKSIGREDSYDVRVILGMLGELGDPSAVEAIVPFLHSEEELVRESAIDALAEIGEAREAIDDLVYITKNDPSPSVRACALKALGKLKDPRGLDALVDAIRYDPDDTVRIAAIEAFQSWKPPEGVEALASFLPQCKDLLQKEMIADALSATDRAGAAKVLIPLLQSKEAKTRAVSAEALGLLGAWEGIEPLIELLTDEDAEVRKSALDALQKIAHNNFGYDIGSWRIWWEGYKEELARRGEIK